MASTAKGNKKAGRNKRKALARSQPLSLFVRGKISAQQYWSMTRQNNKSVNQQQQEQ